MRHRQQPVEVDTGVDPLAVQQVEPGPRSRCCRWREGATGIRPAPRTLASSTPGAVLGCGVRVGVPGVAGVVQVQPPAGHGGPCEAREAAPAPATDTTDADRVGEERPRREASKAARSELDRHRRVDVALERAAEGRGQGDRDPSPVRTGELAIDLVGLCQRLARRSGPGCAGLKVLGDRHSATCTSRQKGWARSRS